MPIIPNVAFSARLQNTDGDPKIILTDTTPYTGGYQQEVIGFFQVLQPDGIELSTGSLTTPSTFWDGSTLLPSQLALRMASNGSFQNGVYTIKYISRLGGFDDTVATQTFTLNYTRKAITLAAAFDLFVPEIRFVDTTTYTYPSGLTFQSITRSWMGMVVGVSAVVGGNFFDFNMAVLGLYYDAEYSAALTAVVQYQLTAATWVTIVDTIAASGEGDAHAVANLNTLLAMLNAMLDNIIANGFGCGSKERDQYVWAKTLFDHYMQMGRCGDTANLYEAYRLLRLAINPLWGTGAHTLAQLTAYNWADFCGCCDSTGSPANTMNKATVVVTSNGFVWQAPNANTLLDMVHVNEWADPAPSINLGTTPGGNDLWDGVNGPTISGVSLINKMLPPNQMVYISGMPAGSYTFIFYYR